MEHGSYQTPERPITDRQILDLLAVVDEVTSRKGFDYSNGDGYQTRTPAEYVPGVVREIFPISVDPSQNGEYQVDLLRHAREFILVNHGIVASITFVQEHTGGPHITNTHS